MIARRYTRVQCAIIGFAVLTTGYIYFAPAIDLCVFMSIIDIEMCVSRDMQPIELCVFRRVDYAEKCGGAQCYIEKSSRILKAI